MYLRRLELTNTGPIKQVKIECRFNEDGSPLPIIFVGQNGAGKSIATAYVVSALIAAQVAVFDDADVEKDRVYKLRSPSYIYHGQTYSIGSVYFDNDMFVSELQLLKIKKEYTENPSSYENWININPEENSDHHSNFYKEIDKTKNSLHDGTYIFFPANRFEDPAWLNELNLKNKVDYSSLNNFTNYSNRPIVNYAPMRQLQSWLLDLIYDSFATENSASIEFLLNSPFGIQQKAKQTRNGPATDMLSSIQTFIKTLFGK
ncbi:hypothetical protein GOZ90_26795 [Agrobacterium vitis]|uniref:Rad50/SbcC-type AAA domain-containing protein n=1 Tax=Agrobacterium vitis TaxID=373 RepID=A0A6L6VQ59_AGRVI|nr:hypothetical protein [Agrobacterium vitis]MUZ76237.1 hypothetical protein [Agrobacterium vitis]